MNWTPSWIWRAILHLCKRSFPIKMLRWHYRSRHESLIAVSNQEFYNNHLLVYPSHPTRSPELGLMYVPLDRDIATYDRGRSSINLEEPKSRGASGLRPLPDLR